MPPLLAPLCPLQAAFLFSLPVPLRICLFSSASRLLADDTNHYETLGVAPDATPAEIKKQFYALSRSHHPDIHPGDPHASDRFSAISNAYSTLAHPEKRKKYDRDHMHRQTSPSHSPGGRTGSYAGSRPASGLSRRRAIFRGPPPSFYAQGGNDAPPRPSSSSSSSSRTAPGGGFNPFAGPTSGLDNDLPPHFDRYARDQVFRTQSDQDSRRAERMYRRSAAGRAAESDRVAGSLLLRFIAVSGIVGFGVGISTTIAGWSSRKEVERGKRV